MDARVLCLGVLTLGDASGYEIRKQFEEGPFAYFHEVSLGSIYPALAKLTGEGLVTFTEHAQDGKPDKKVYTLTEDGRAHFVKALDKDPASDKFRSEALYQMFFADFLSEERRLQVYNSYLGLHRAYVAEMEAETCGANLDGAPPGRRFVHGLGLVIYKAVIDYMENNRDLISIPAETER
ncbi:PadR family transcriptional regulator [Magnetospira sp. QH-2]|uniref:PadR family transcriptional regulator n=1 Tax=Magnetospira sp. (strain QH-2) TaxID=1288970 RepID=UPI0003E818E3|nr:PadR family transcriptional regulator [Magnetospira sp. QH-2]CCQ74308.1 Transcriptional regulator, PadR family protein [Magnetospira sp. QH-2]